jgi:hypothetical protein
MFFRSADAGTSDTASRLESDDACGEDMESDSGMGNREAGVARVGCWWVWRGEG